MFSSVPQEYCKLLRMLAACMNLKKKGQCYSQNPCDFTFHKETQPTDRVLTLNQG